MAEVLFTIISIVLVDLVLGGDNAVVIAMASRSLPLEQRRKAIYWGTVGAVGLRFIFASVATVLLGVPYLMLAGGLLLTWIAYKLLVEEEHHEVAEAKSVADAVRTIIIADAVMSLDNALAVAGVAHGHIGWLAFGIGFSVPIIVFGSQLIARIMNRFPIIVYVGAGVLAWTAGKLIAEDPIVHHLIGENGVVTVGVIDLLLVLGAGYLVNRRRRTAAPRTGDDGDGTKEGAHAADPSRP